MTNIILAILVLLFGILVGFLIPAVIELRRTARETSDFLKNTESSLKPVLEELEGTLKNLRSITEDINKVSSDVRTVSSSVVDVAESVRGIAELVDEARKKTRANIMGIRAGTRTAIEVLIKNLIKTGGSQ